MSQSMLKNMCICSEKLRYLPETQFIEKTNIVFFPVLGKTKGAWLHWNRSFP